MLPFTFLYLHLHLRTSPKKNANTEVLSSEKRSVCKVRPKNSPRGNFAGVFQKAGKICVKNMCANRIRIPGTQMTLVLVGKGLVLRGLPSIIEVIWVLNIYNYIWIYALHTVLVYKNVYIYIPHTPPRSSYLHVA